MAVSAVGLVRMVMSVELEPDRLEAEVVLLLFLLKEMIGGTVHRAVGGGPVAKLRNISRGQRLKIVNEIGIFHLKYERNTGPKDLVLSERHRI